MAFCCGCFYRVISLLVLVEMCLIGVTWGSFIGFVKDYVSRYKFVKKVELMEP